MAKPLSSRRGRHHYEKDKKYYKFSQPLSLSNPMYQLVWSNSTLVSYKIHLSSTSPKTITDLTLRFSLSHCETHLSSSSPVTIRHFNKTLLASSWGHSGIHQPLSNKHNSNNDQPRPKPASTEVWCLLQRGWGLPLKSLEAKLL